MLLRIFMDVNKFREPLEAFSIHFIDRFIVIHTFLDFLILGVGNLKLRILPLRVPRKLMKFDSRNAQIGV